MEELEHIVYCERVGKPVLITVHKSGEIVSLCCHHEEGGRDCQHRAELGCALYRKFSGRGNPVVEDLSKVLGRRTECVLEASKALTESGVPFVIGGRDAVNAYCPGVVEETLRTDFFIRSVDRNLAWKVLSKSGFGLEPIDPTCCVATKGGRIELHYGRPPEKPEYVDEETIARAVKVKLVDLYVSLQPLEELVAYKADRFTERDSSDLRRLLREWGDRMDLKYLTKMAKKRGLSLEKLLITENRVMLKEP
jgi:DNA-binding phage protein